MGLTGNLATMELQDLLLMLERSRATGTLRLSSGSVEKSVFFLEGRVVSSASSEPLELLGHFLVGRGLLTEDTLAAAVREHHRRQVPLGQVLVEQGAISQQELERMLVLKAEESLYELFSWTTGEFRFDDGDLPRWQMVAIPQSVEGLVLEGLRRLDEWRRIRRAIPSANAVPVAVGELLDDLESSDRDRAILGAVDDDRSIRDICLETHSSESEVCRVLFRAVQRRRLKVVRPRNEAPADDLGAEPEVDALLARARQLMERTDFQHAVRHLRAATSLAPDRSDVRSAVREVEHELVVRLVRDGVAMSGVPRVADDAVQGGAGLSPEEAFVLSRIDGRSRVESILNISPLPELDAMVTIWKLYRAGLITFRG